MNSSEMKPIVSDESFYEVLNHIIQCAEQLSSIILKHDLPIDTLCIFTHSDAEYSFVHDMILSMGEKSKLSHGPTTYVDVRLKVGGHAINILGVRKPDRNRPWRGYADYPVDTELFHTLILESELNANMTPITSGLSKTLIQVEDKKSDVVGFVVEEAHLGGKLNEA